MINDWFICWQDSYDSDCDTIYWCLRLNGIYLGNRSIIERYRALGLCRFVALESILKKRWILRFAQYMVNARLQCYRLTGTPIKPIYNNNYLNFDCIRCSEFENVESLQ